jgi:hypothetical protein
MKEESGPFERNFCFNLENLGMSFRGSHPGWDIWRRGAVKDVPCKCILEFLLENAEAEFNGNGEIFFGSGFFLNK